jgi:tetratricopeptide (TPR) repeat protein
MRCSNCNSEVKRGDKKCPSCGATLIWPKEKKKTDKAPASKRPISIVFIAIIASAFFIFFIMAIAGASFDHSFNYAQAISVTFIVFSSICIIAFFFLILVNKGANRKRMKNFIIALGVAVAILAIFSVIQPISRNPYQSAEGFFSEKSYENAIKYYQIVIDENKNSEQIAEAKNKIIEAQIFIDEANSYMDNGDQYYDNNQFALALAEYESAKEIYPYLVGLDDKITSCNNEIEEQKKAAVEKQEKIEELLSQGEDLFQGKKYIEALERYKQAVELESSNEEAKNMVEKIEIIIADVEELISEGDILFNDNKYEEALLKYKEAENIYPDYQRIVDKIEITEKEIDKKQELAEEEPVYDEAQEDILEFAYSYEFPDLWGTIRICEPPLVKFSNIEVHQGRFLLSDNEVQVIGKIEGLQDISLALMPESGVFTMLAAVITDSKGNIKWAQKGYPIEDSYIHQGDLVSFRLINKYDNKVENGDSLILVAFIEGGMIEDDLSYEEDIDKGVFGVYRTETILKTDTEEAIEEPEDGEENQNTSETSPEETGSATLGEKNALKTALDYLNYTSFSYSGLVEQLKFEGYTHKEAVYGADNCGADWNEQALKSALDYLAYTAFSYSGLVGQLKFEGFTNEQAVYGVDRCGANWNEQAAKMAQDYLDYSSFSRTELIAQLEYEGFTRQQAEYGVQAVGY